MKKKNKPIWGTRIKSKTTNTFMKVSSSLGIDRRLFKEDIKASIAHVEMLNRQKIINFKTKNKIIWGLKRINNQIVKKKYLFDYKDEDIHMSIEKRLFELIGEDAGFVHTARSRNDQVLVDFKLWMIESSDDIIKEIDSTIKLIIKIAEKNIYTVMPSFTHLKNAQPTSFAHYILAYVEMLTRDKKRFLDNKQRLLENPLGVAAVVGTSFDIDREYTTKKLKFKNPTGNSIDTVSDRDFVLDFLYSISVCSNHISRFAEEFILWNSDAFDLIKLKDKVVTGSSIMPQKKNPDATELVRSKTGRIFGSLFNVMAIQKGIPSGYSKDLQEDKEPVFDSYNTIEIILDVMNETIKKVLVNKKKMYEESFKGYTTATDLADWMVKNLDITFREAHNKTGKIVLLAEQKKKKLYELTLEQMQSVEPKINVKIFNVISPENSINEKKSYGGTSLGQVKNALKRAKKRI